MTLQVPSLYVSWPEGQKELDCRINGCHGGDARNPGAFMESMQGKRSRQIFEVKGLGRFFDFLGLGFRAGFWFSGLRA